MKYVYEQVSRTGPYARQAGEYTRYGNVLPLLKSFDDKLAVFGSGEEVQLEFDPAKLPPVPKGWTRDYFFQANGYEKDMDFYAAEGASPLERTHTIMEDWGYTGSACVGMALDSAIEHGKVKPGSLLVLVGSGVGYNQAGVAFRMP